MKGCICPIRHRAWRIDGTCARCGSRVDEVRQLAPWLHSILCAQGTGLVLWRNPRGYDERAHNHYGLSAGAGDYVGMYAGRWVEVEIKTAIGRLDSDQRARGALVARLGGVYAVVRSEAAAQELLSYLRGSAPRPSFVFAPAPTTSTPDQPST